MSAGPAAGAFILYSNFGLYPQDAVQVAVGESGVGAARQAARVGLFALGVRAGGMEGREVRRTFGDVAVNMPVAYIGSCGTLEVAVREGDAAGAAGLRVGDTVSIYRSDRR